MYDDSDDPPKLADMSEECPPVTITVQMYDDPARNSAAGETSEECAETSDAASDVADKSGSQTTTQCQVRCFRYT